MENTEQAISKELDTRIKLTKQQSEKIYTKIGKNLLIAILVLIYFCFLNLGYLRLEENVFKTDLKVFAISLVISTIVVLECAYRRDSIEATFCGIELLVLSIITLYLPYVYFYQSTIAKILFVSASLYITIYYMIKSIFIYIIEKKKYVHKYSDIKDIIKSEKKSYLDEQNKRKYSDKQETKINKKKIVTEDLPKKQDNKQKKPKAKKTENKKKVTKNTKLKNSKKKGDSND